jgi:DNA-directed RNA polymerase subunit RPC12/RpoP
MTATLNQQFPCAQCGADLRYDVGTEHLFCDYCSHENIIDIEHTPIQELDFRKGVADQLSTEQIETTQVAKCTTCGAQVEFEPNIHADNCPFCDSVLVTDTGAHRHFKPAGLLPFAVSQKDAQRALSDWLGSRWFAPSGLKRYARAGQELNGIYTPYWTFDADTASAYRGQRGDVYYVDRYVTVMTDKGPRRQLQRIPQIRWTPVSGRVRRFFDDVLVTASKALPKQAADALEPWDLHALVPYTKSYLAGFRAEGYTIDLRDGFAAARGEMDLQIRRDVRFDIGGDQQRVDTVETEFGDVTFKHILLPLWIAAYRYRDRTYRFAINGRSGRVFGERPYSAWKIAAAVILGAIGMLALIGALYASGALDQVVIGNGQFSFPNSGPYYPRGY